MTTTTTRTTTVAVAAAGAAPQKPAPKQVLPPTRADLHPLKVLLPPEIRSLPTLLDPRLPAKKKPISEFSAPLQKRLFDPYTPMKKRIPQILFDDEPSLVQLTVA